MKKDFSNIDWYCDGCGTYLNKQHGFSGRRGVRKCTQCGYKNLISEENIIEEMERDNSKRHRNRILAIAGVAGLIFAGIGVGIAMSKLKDSDDEDDYDEENNYNGIDGEEYLSADDAALIWGSRGMDEDYMFDYSEDELSKYL